MRVLMNELGDAQTFTIAPLSLQGVSQTYYSFSEAVDEVKEARIWGGMHFRTACELGQQTGYAYADWLLANYLRPRGNKGRQAGQ